MGQREPLRNELHVAEQQHIDVDHPRPMAHPAGRPADETFNLLARVEQLERLKSRLDPHARVEELGLVKDEPDRLGVVHGRGGEHLHSMRRQLTDRCGQVLQALADVRAESEIPLTLTRRHATARAQASDSRHTSTDTSLTLNGSGGSGLAALTHTIRAP